LQKFILFLFLKSANGQPTAGSVYLQAYFVPDGSKDPNTKPVDIDGKVTLASDNIIRGTLKVRAVHARELKAADRGSSDPYVIVKFPNGEEAESEVKKDTLNPLWKQIISKKIEVPLEVK
jgi:Ca2+-dependent lipid-binding protein